ncbi:Type IV pilus biogenesis and competence protein PilQ precursor [Planctomycetes bacterium Pla163]|uniref:Type IV pilus biogenesis and competence protein PilQ n=1 Tax=Rohdeia mirabilis TaxID=2528008 RepID=A0A518D2N7_9BACT|nr:Type IV pilus biogenesis and competence protein PilQ precursor [Planctomycetes bacterium Pla163]
MNPIRTIVATLVALLTTVGAAHAQTPDPDARVSIRVDGRQLQEVVEFLRDRSGSNIVVLQGGDTPISLKLTDVPWREVLELAAESAGCVVEERTAGVLALTRPERVTFAFSNAELTEVIDTIGRVSGANIVTAPEVSGVLSLRLTEVPWRDALEVATKTLGFVVVEDRRGILRVVDPASLQDQMVVKSYQLRYMRPRATFAPVIKSDFVSGEHLAASGVIEEDFPVIEALRQALSPNGQLHYVEDRNVLIVRDTDQVHAYINDVVERLDIEPPQIFIDVKFVSTTNTDLWDLGVDFGDFGPRVSVSGGQVPISFPFEMGAGGFEDGLLASDTGTGPFAEDLVSFAGGVTSPDTIFGALNFTTLAATLRAIERDVKSEVVQAPKLVALDGRPSTIFVGETIRYAEARTEQGQAGGLNLSVQEANGSPVEIGFQLMVRCNVIPGTNDMTLEVIPKETNLSGTGNSSLAPDGFDVFTVGASGAEGSIALPRVRSSTIVTSMMLESGQTAVIGGLSTDVARETRSQIPFLGSIPILGRLFRHDEKSKERRSLMVFVTPTIVRSSSDADDLLRRELARRQDMYSGELERLLFGEDFESEDGQLEAPVQGEVDVSTFDQD